MMQCGVHLEQDLQGHWHLSQEEFCQSISQVEESGATKDFNQHELHQCRAVLGAAQWRCDQTGPQYSAKLNHLQSLLPRGDRQTLRDINMFVRELYHQKDEKITVYDFKADSDEDIILVEWTGAALANRVDLTSTGGYVIGSVHRNMLERGVAGPVSLASWSTHKLRQVCRSSLEAEGQAMSEGEAELFINRILWQELFGKDVDLSHPSTTAALTTGALVTDAKALYDMLQPKDIP